MGAGSALRRLQQADDMRSGVPGEHWATFGLGAALWRWARRSPSPLLRTAGMVGSALLVWRAASGRDGVLQRLRRHAR